MLCFIAPGVRDETADGKTVGATDYVQRVSTIHCDMGIHAVVVGYFSCREAISPNPRTTASARSGTSDRDLSDFLLRACHDLRASARAIRAQAELLQRDGQDFERRLGFIVDGARRIDLLTDGLSSYSIALKIDDASFQFTPLDGALRTALARLDKELR